MGGTAVTEGDRATELTAVRMCRLTTRRMREGEANPTRASATMVEEGIMLDTKIVTWSLAVFASITYVFCVLYGLIVPETLHMSAFLEQILPGFEWLTPRGFVVGLVEAFLYGAYTGLVFAPVYNVFQRRWGVG